MMRNFEQRKAEIFRRSNERIRKRRRGRILVCSALVVCVAVCSVILLPFGRKDEVVLTQYACPYGMAEVTNQTTGEAQKFTDRGKVTDILETIQSICKDDAPANSEETAETAVYDAGRQGDYLITFTDFDGSQTVYSLIGNCLVDQSAQQELLLSDSQLSEIKTVLQLTP